VQPHAIDTVPLVIDLQKRFLANVELRWLVFYRS
jgi:hypothetical protein